MQVAWRIVQRTTCNLYHSGVSCDVLSHACHMMYHAAYHACHTDVSYKIFFMHATLMHHATYLVMHATLTYHAAHLVMHATLLHHATYLVMHFTLTYHAAYLIIHARLMYHERLPH